MFVNSWRLSPFWHRLTGVEAMQKVVDAWSKAPLYPDVPDALRLLHNANIKVGAAACSRRQSPAEAQGYAHLVDNSRRIRS